MSSRLLLVVTVLCTFGTSIPSASAKPVKMRIDPSTSFVKFRATQNVVGNTEGKFGKFSGEFTIDKDKISSTTGTVAIQAASIYTGDSSRDDHLKNEDFFDVTKHRVIKFRIKEAKQTSPGNVRVRGQAIVKGKRSTLSFDLALEWDDVKGRVRAFGSFSISRKAIGIDYTASFFIPSIHDKIHLILDIALVPASG